MKPNIVVRKRDVGLLPDKSGISPTYLLLRPTECARGKPQGLNNVKPSVVFRKPNVRLLPDKSGISPTYLLQLA